MQCSEPHAQVPSFSSLSSPHPPKKIFSIWFLFALECICYLHYLVSHNMNFIASHMPALLEWSKLLITINSANYNIWTSKKSLVRTIWNPFLLFYLNSIIQVIRANVNMPQILEIHLVQMTNAIWFCNENADCDCLFITVTGQVIFSNFWFWAFILP